jgi:SPP1 gp7 family putative phage head morphogenesis protein
MGGANAIAVKGVADLSQQIEAFLRNALRAKKLEDRLIKQALRDLRTTLIAVERVVGSSGVLAVGPNRERTIQAVVAAVANSVQESFGIPQLAAMQEALAPFVEQQLEFARRMVTMAGGELSNEGAVAITNAQVNRIVNDAVVGGKTLSAQLTQTLPAAVADRVERFIRLGLSDLGGETFATYEDAVVRVTQNNVEAIIRTGVHEVGNAAQQAIYEFETDPAWLGAEGLVWTATLDSSVCPICLALDGKRFPVDYKKVSPHFQCRCYLLPWKWRNEDMTNPSGEPVAPQRLADGDGPEAGLSFKVAAKRWVKDNPATAQSIFGKKLGQRLVDGEIGFDKAVKLWQAPKG